MKNVLIIGLGSIGQRHLRNLFAINKNLNFFAYRRIFKTPSLSNKNSVIKIDIKKKYKIKYLLSLNNLKKYKIDTAFICSPSSFHIDEAIILLKQNINTFVEKPLGNSIKKIKILKTILKKTTATSMMGYQMKFCPIINKLKEYVIKKSFGRPLYISIQQGENIKDFHKYEDYKKSYASIKNLGGGVVLSQIHDLDYLIYIFQNYRISSLKSFSKKLSQLSINVEDTLAASILLKKNNEKILCNLSLNYYEVVKKREINIVFEKASVQADLVNQYIKIRFPYKQKLQKFNYEKNELFKKQILFFKKYVEKNKKVPFLYSIENDIETLKVALKLKKQNS